MICVLVVFISYRRWCCKGTHLIFTTRSGQLNTDAISMQSDKMYHNMTYTCKKHIADTEKVHNTSDQKDISQYMLYVTEYT